MLLQNDQKQLLKRFKEVRYLSEQLTEPLEIEDFVVQGMADASPPKWHLAHTTWFFERFILKDHLAGYEELNPQFDYLFNSYYETIGPFHPRNQRGLLTRPTAKEVFSYRNYVNAHIEKLFNDLPESKAELVLDLLEIGLQHEQQHQELLLTDIKYNFAQNPLLPVYSEASEPSGINSREFAMIPIDGGLAEIGHSGRDFCFDNESPRHKVYLEPFSLASHPVTNGEYVKFIEGGGYEKPEYWLSDGWTHIKKEGWNAPMYWFKAEDGWNTFTLSGQKKIGLDEPVCHVSFYEADAYARWAGKRLPTEAEWEHALESTVCEGNFVESRNFHPRPANSRNGKFYQAYGDVWEWTASAYTPYPGSKPLEGALGEYNAKFMCNQMVLRGGSCATSSSHIRSSYRNFFQPEKRWQFSGFRLAEDAE
ncbi:ergothioneine biosynthesis protein EgtB [Metabacillus sp. KIGAM252]|uniref:Ergothioneine biosynthesis protein EgtB n=1 Tax=Metabacillus flavus TaxID=2823519 RepID=A0ABS5LDB0_9BACI|nr:ergothioneine biosynthesis protein EgtB [Metabacillus flavus]MBS2968728.1 ergothioneine biosynthesis protein EgtB [Metabacillus flavus]